MTKSELVALAGEVIAENRARYPALAFSVFLDTQAPGMTIIIFRATCGVMYSQFAVQILGSRVPQGSPTEAPKDSLENKAAFLAAMEYLAKVFGE